MQQRPLSGQIALVTGAARGIGRAIAKRLAEAGADIAINYYNSIEEAESLSEIIQATGSQAIILHGSVSDPASVKEMAASLQHQFGRLNILINNAASGVLKPMMEMGLKHFRWCMETNAFALPLLIKEMLPLLQSGTRILALTSLGSERALPDYGFIGASKAALESLVRSLSVELAPKNISLNTISAGAVDTDALKYFPAHDRIVKEAKTRSLTGRMVKPEDVADVAYLLCLPEAKMIRGQVIYVDAGYNIVG